MKNEPLPTNNPEWGFWGTSVSNGYDAAMTWDTASRFFAKTFNLTPEETRTLLDARFGRHLADDLSFINGGPATADAITAHLEKRNADKGWRRHFEKAIREETGKRIPYSAPKSKAEILTAIAQEMDRHVLVAQALEGQRDAHPVRGGRAEVVVELHGVPLARMASMMPPLPATCRSQASIS